MSSDYRKTFPSDESARHYDEQVFGPGSYAALLWELERQQLDRWLSSLIPAQRDIRYLDFACGTGRVISFVEERVATSVGVDISESMVAIARRRTKSSRLVVCDLTDSEPGDDEAYDVITAFRFFLNAEPSLRSEAMAALAARLADTSSILILSVQGHSPSYKVAVRALRALWYAGRPRLCLMSKKEVATLAGEHGLDIRSSYGYDFFSSLSLRLLPYGAVRSVERWLAGRMLLHHFGGHRLYVLGKAGQPHRA